MAVLLCCVGCTSETPLERVEREKNDRDQVSGGSKTDVEREAREMAKQVVLQHLRYPNNANFHMLEWQHGFANEDRMVIIAGKVDAKNALGGEHTYDFGVKYARDGSTWHCFYLQIGDDIPIDRSSDLAIREILHPGSTAAERERQQDAAMAAVWEKEERLKREQEAEAKRRPVIPRGIVEFDEQEPRSWTSADGKFSVEATLVRFDQSGKTITIRKSDGEDVTIDIEKLSLDDRNHARQLARDAK